MNYAVLRLPHFNGHPRRMLPEGIRHFAATVGESMVAIQPDLSPRPLLAESWEISDDGTTWTWRIRDGVWFHNRCGPKRNQSCGNMTIHDVLWSYKEYHEGSIHPGAQVIGDFWVGKAGGFQRVIDDYTAEIGTGEPLMQQRALNFMRHLGDFSTSIVSMEQTQEMFEAKGGNWNDRYLEDDPSTEVDESLLVSPEYETAAFNAGELVSATGPWEIEEHSLGYYWKLRAVENHWRQTPYFAQLNVYYISDRDTRIAAFQGGQLDVMEMASGLLPAVQAAEGTEIIVWPNAEQIRLNFHGRTYRVDEGTHPLKGPTCDFAWVSCDEDTTSLKWLNAVKVRKALAIAIDRQSIVDDVISGYGEPLHMIDWLGHEDTADPRWVHEYNPDLARRLLAEAGYGADNKIRIDIDPSAMVSNRQYCKAVAEYWEAVGITIGLPIKSGIYQPEGRASCHTVSKHLRPALGTSDYLDKSEFIYGTGHPWLEENIIDLLGETNPTQLTEKELQVYGWMYDSVIAVGLYSIDGIWPVGKRLDPNWRPIDYSELGTPTGFEYIKRRQ